MSLGRVLPAPAGERWQPRGVVNKVGVEFGTGDGGGTSRGLEERVVAAQDVHRGIGPDGNDRLRHTETVRQSPRQIARRWPA